MNNTVNSQWAIKDKEGVVHVGFGATGMDYKWLTLDDYEALTAETMKSNVMYLLLTDDGSLSFKMIGDDNIIRESK